MSTLDFPSQKLQKSCMTPTNESALSRFSVPRNGSHDWSQQQVSSSLASRERFFCRVGAQWKRVRKDASQVAFPLLKSRVNSVGNGRELGTLDWGKRGKHCFSGSGHVPAGKIRPTPEEAKATRTTTIGQLCSLAFLLRTAEGSIIEPHIIDLWPL